LKKISFICNWGKNPSELLSRYLKQTPGHSGRWNNLVGVENLNEADFFIIQEGLPPHLVSKIDLKRSLYIKREPPHVSPHANNVDMDKVFKTFNWPPYRDEYLPAAWWIEKSYDDLMSLPYSLKEKKASCVTTNKYSTRTRFITSYARTYPDSLDVFGRWNFGHGNDFKNSSSYKGELRYAGNCKFEGLYPYQYTLALENGSIKNYWSEKIIDAFLSWAMPIYYGCTNITDYFPDVSLHQIDLTQIKDVERINHIIQEPPTTESIEAIEYSREKILNTYNLWAVIERTLEEN